MLGSHVVSPEEKKLRRGYFLSTAGMDQEDVFDTAYPMLKALFNILGFTHCVGVLARNMDGYGGITGHPTALDDAYRKGTEAVTAFVLNKSIVDNANTHVGNHYVYNIDLKDFFHSFDRNRVKMAFMYEPFNLSGEKESLAFLLASLCTHPFEVNGQIKNVLPQGSPTSPTLTNILCKKLDRRLTGLANRFGAKYTRYADDISFSSPHNIYHNEDFKKELERIITEDNIIKTKKKQFEIGQQLKINTEKTRLLKSAHRQEVTGLIVNDKVNVRKRYLKQLRMWLYYWEKYGYEKAQEIFTKDYIKDKGHVKNAKPNLINVLDGKLEYLKMVKGREDSTYNKLKARFDALSSEKLPINDILDVWEKEGIEKAMEKYNTEIVSA